MKTLFAYVFAAATLFPPSGFVCVEANGDVHWEFATCSSAEATESTVFAVEAKDCGDCRDTAISASSTPIQRTLLTAAAPLFASVGAAPIIDYGQIVARQTAFASSPPHSLSRHLSSTVIRR